MSLTENNFNLLRLIAALQVVVIHSSKHLQIENNIVDLIVSIVSFIPGVPVFFLISGYLIGLSYDKNRDLVIYAKNRFFRIIPALYVCFIISCIILYNFNELDNVPLLEFFSWSIAQLTVVQFFNPEFLRSFGVGVLNGSLWTISVEISFYFILPLLFVFFRKYQFLKASVLIIISFFIYHYFLNTSVNATFLEKLLRVSILPYLFYFLFGLLIYQNIIYLKRILFDKFYIYIVIYIILINFNMENIYFSFIKQIVFSLVVFSFAFSFRKLTNSILGTNDFTYGIYIYHMLIINIFIQMNYTKDVSIFIFTLVLSIIFGALSYYFVEKPFLNFKKNSIYYQNKKNN